MNGSLLKKQWQSLWRNKLGANIQPSVEKRCVVDIHVGEIYGKQTTGKFVMYNVLKVSKSIITLQNIDNPLSLFETSAEKLSASGYIRISQTPYIDLEASTAKRRKASKKPTRCPLTFDFLEERADSERPAPIMPDLFTAQSWGGPPHKSWPSAS